jgi:hypothetical protein
MIKRILRLPALPTAFVLMALASTVGVLMHNMMVAVVVPYCGVMVAAFACIIANSVRYGRMGRHPLANLSSRELRYLCKQHPEIKVTFYDSVRAGNCILGTSGFVRRTFKGRRSITLPELSRYVGAYRVNTVIVYKLQEAGVDWESERAGYMSAPLEAVA